LTIPAFTHRAVFRAFGEEVLAPTLRPGEVVVLDNLPAHKYPEIGQAIAAAQCRLLYLPRYSPAFDPIEPCWSKLKNSLRPRAARTLESLQGAVTDTSDCIPGSDACGWFTHCGYKPAPE
jgi:transposase